MLQGIATAAALDRIDGDARNGATLRMDLNYCGVDEQSMATTLATGQLMNVTTNQFMSHPLCPLLNGVYRSNLHSIRSVHIPMGTDCDRLVEGIVQIFGYQ